MGSVASGPGCTSSLGSEQRINTRAQFQPLRCSLSTTSGATPRRHATSTAVSGASYVGGLVGNRDYTWSTVNNSFWNTETSGMSTSAGGIGMTTAQMQTQANLTSAAAANGNVNPNCDFTNVWRMYEGHTYPLLKSFLTPITVTANNVGTTYNGLTYSDPSGVTYSIPGATLLGTVAYADAGTGQPVADAGTYTIVPTGLWSNQQGYDISYATGTLTINPVLLTWGVADALSTYGTVPVPGTATLTGIVSGDDVTGTVGLFKGTKQITPSATLRPGKYKEKVIGLTGTDSANYTLSPTGNTTGTLKIRPR